MLIIKKPKVFLKCYFAYIFKFEYFMKYINKYNSKMQFKLFSSFKEHFKNKNESFTYFSGYKIDVPDNVLSLIKKIYSFEWENFPDIEQILNYSFFDEIKNEINQTINIY